MEGMALCARCGHQARCELVSVNRVAHRLSFAQCLLKKNLLRRSGSLKVAGALTEWRLDEHSSS